MALAIVYSRAQVGISAPAVTVEVHLSNGLPSFSIVGLPETAVKESKDRVRSALLNSRFEFPRRRITVNLAPADLPKEGGRFDLPIALALLAASGQVPRLELDAHEFLGELALDGNLRAIHGVLPAAICARQAGRRLIVPGANGPEAALVEGGGALTATHLLRVCEHLHGRDSLTPATAPERGPEASYRVCLSEVRGQAHAKRALEIAAAGGHSLLLAGHPGTGKTMLAIRLPTILPPMTEAEAVETAAVASVSTEGLDPTKWRCRPFRAPHHTASCVALAGGGTHPRPGEISLAHHGVLFLDELPEFDRRTLEVLREPLESGRITVSRAARHAEFPARFQLIAAMNPCPCGYLGDPSGRCRCTETQVRRYRNRLSGPLLDRIDMHIEVGAVDLEVLRAPATGEASSAQVRTRVTRARQRQLGRSAKPNHELAPQELDRHCRLDFEGQRLLEQATRQLGLSARAYHRIVKVARTIADLDDSEAIATRHLSEAVSYRRLDRALSSASR